ncbi:prolipoprotein diacylglyceryl transferase [Candidatus Woesearchaeota archaeon]|nr:prolipoprotein diacylglyceryl transferase [Candidatus Woesearchaeota archaeon]
MITWDLSPVFVRLGIIELRWYGLVYALGFLLAYFILKRLASEEKLGWFNKKDSEDLIFWLITGSILGARLLYVLVYNPLFYLANPLAIFMVWEGGLSIHGGLLGAVIAVMIYARRKSIPFFQISDVLVLPLALVIVFGRVANYMNGELWGTLTSASWCVDFGDGCRHPSQLYEAAYSLALFVILLVMRETKKLKEGTLTWIFFLLYGFFRFFVTFFRALDPTDPGILGLALGQWLSLALIAAAGYALLRERF